MSHHGSQSLPANYVDKLFTLTGSGGFVRNPSTESESLLTGAAQTTGGCQELEDLLDMNGIEARVVLIESTCGDLIEVLGSIYEMDLEFWAQHFLLKENECWLWPEAQQHKPFFSVRWSHAIAMRTESLDTPSWHHHQESPLCCGYHGPSREFSFQAAENDSKVIPETLDRCVSVYFYKHATTHFERTGPRPHQSEGLDSERRWSLDYLWDSLIHHADNATSMHPHMVVGSIFDWFQQDYIILVSKTKVLVEGIRKQMRDPTKLHDSIQSRSWESTLATLSKSNVAHRHAISTFLMAFSILDRHPYYSKLEFPQGPSIKLVDTENITFSAEASLREAKIMKKLTELVFIFIPLSLSTSIFGMEMQEFKDGIPLYYWVITAVCLLLASCAVRWLVRSRPWKAVQTAWINKATTLYPEYRGNEASIPTSRYVVALLYYLHQLELSIFDFLEKTSAPHSISDWDDMRQCVPNALMVTIPTIPVPIVWTRNSISLDAKIAWTILMAVSCAYVCAWLHLAWQSSYDDHVSRTAKAYILTVFPVILGVLAPVAFTLAWALPTLSHQGRVGWTAVGSILVGAALGLLSIRQTLRFTTQLDAPYAKFASD
ncbi:hypothetical protein QBC38DRAFT_545844 [Podospora fimiseda]|uniref:Uncharacterized protein n=1 Tax=Podospora fimiseda TaxID=252190 RepID=A0AAN7BNE3_9PEZI|nr:hypothetical protein QBC38DRAFT_545844 [Podospora fimiseda]